MTATTTATTTATKLALAASVAAPVGCSSTGESSNTATTNTGGITQAVARGAVLGETTTTTTVGNTTNTNTTTTAQVNLANARNGEQVNLTLVDPVAATATDPAVAGSATLRGSGSTATQTLTLEQVGTQTIAANSADNRTGTDLTARFFGTAAPNSTAASPELADDTDNLTVIDATYARIAFGGIAPTAANGNQTNAAFIVGPKEADTERAAPTAGTATYRGDALGLSLSPSQVDGLGGEIELRADFGASTIEGEIALDDRPEEVRLRNGVIDGVDYRGNVAIVDPTGASTYAATGRGGNERAAFRGGFYGPNAEETVGVVDYLGQVTDTATGATQNVDALGNFIATKQ